MRLHALSEAEVTRVVASGESSLVDPGGRPIFTGRTEDGRVVNVLTAPGDPELVIAFSCELERSR
jgi:hypothetical protein